MRTAFSLLSLFAACALSVQAAPFDTVCHKVIFADQLVNFDTEAYPKALSPAGDHITIGNGRIHLKKISIPKIRRNARATLTVRVCSNGDPWDKTGSVFIIPATSGISMVGVARGTQNYPAVDSTRYERLRGIMAGEDYLPTVELMRFYTPFGVGAFNPRDEQTREHRMPTYIDGFADYAEWIDDVSDRLPLLVDSVYVGLAIDSWTKPGYRATVTLTIEESTLKADKSPHRHVLPLLNTIQYFGQEYCDIFARKPLDIHFSLPVNARNVQLYYIATGHGGQDGGDEFTPCENILSLDGIEVKRFTPWRNDCASFRRFNPATGVWLKEREVSYIGPDGKRAVKKIEEPFSSSDLSRSGWCPGSDAPPCTIPLHPDKTGKHKLRIAIPTAQPLYEGNQNHWLISAWLTWEE